jgi:hypothetical protein
VEAATERWPPASMIVTSAPWSLTTVMALPLKSIDSR